MKSSLCFFTYGKTETKLIIMSSLFKQDENGRNSSINSSLNAELPSEKKRESLVQKVLNHKNNSQQHQLHENRAERKPSNEDENKDDVDLPLSRDNHNVHSSVSFQDMTFSAHCLEWLVLIAGFSELNSKCPCCGKLYSVFVFLSIVFSLVIEIYNYTPDTSWLYFAIFTIYIQVLVLYLVAKCKLMPDLYQNTPDGTSIVRASAASIAHGNSQTPIRGDIISRNKEQKHKKYSGRGNCSLKHRLQLKSHGVLRDVMHSPPKHASCESYLVLQQTQRISSTSSGIKLIFFDIAIVFAWACFCYMLYTYKLHMFAIKQRNVYVS